MKDKLINFASAAGSAIVAGVLQAQGERVASVLFWIAAGIFAVTFAMSFLVKRNA